MQFYRNSEVFSKNNEKIGTSERIVIDPKTKEVTHLVVDKGFLFSDDKLVPVELVDHAMDDQIFLNVTEDQLDDMQDFEETFHINSSQVSQVLSRDDSQPAREMLAYPPVNAHWWIQAGYPLPNYVKHTVQYNPDGTVPLKEGADVYASDDEKIGQVDAFLTEPSENRISHILISQGILFEKKVLIPSIWISRVMEDKIHLVVDRDLIERLPEYEMERSLS